MKSSMTKAQQSVVGLLATAFMLTACSPLSEAQREDRVSRHAAFALKFQDYRARCNASGKRVFVVASQSIGRDGIPNIGDRYFCD